MNEMWQKKLKLKTSNTRKETAPDLAALFSSNLRNKSSQNIIHKFSLKVRHLTLLTTAMSIYVYFKGKWNMHVMEDQVAMKLAFRDACNLLPGMVQQLLQEGCSRSWWLNEGSLYLRWKSLQQAQKCMCKHKCLILCSTIFHTTMTAKLWGPLDYVWCACKAICSCSNLSPMAMQTGDS